MMKRWGIILVFWTAMVPSIAQQFSPKKIDRHADDAVSYYQMGDYLTAKKHFIWLLEMQPGDAAYAGHLGGCYLYLDNDLDSAAYFLQMAVDSGDVEAMFDLAICLHRQLEIDSSNALLDRYSAHPDRKRLSIEILRQRQTNAHAKTLMATPLDVTIAPINGPVNSPYPEYVPLISQDESILIFTSRRPGGASDDLDPLGRYYEDVYWSEQVDGLWSKPEGIGATVNQPGHDACVGLSPDGGTLIIYRTDETLLGGDLYWSTFQDSVWSEPVMFSDAINSEALEASACFSPDGNTLYFSSNRPGGYGGLDLYRSIKFGNGEWSLPVNLGPTINTMHNEDAPFMHPFDSTLYFASQGHVNMGGYDIFTSRLVDQQRWSTPENMGFPVNGPDNELYFILNQTLDRGYYASQRADGLGGQDIYVCDMYEYAQPQVVVRGQVTGHNDPLKAKLTVRDEADKLIGIYRSNARNGRYILVLPPNHAYKLELEADGYQPMHMSLEYNVDDTRTELELNLKMQPTDED